MEAERIEIRFLGLTYEIIIIQEAKRRWWGQVNFRYDDEHGDSFPLEVRYGLKHARSRKKLYRHLGEFIASQYQHRLREKTIKDAQEDK